MELCSKWSRALKSSGLAPVTGFDKHVALPGKEYIVTLPLRCRHVCAHHWHPRPVCAVFSMVAMSQPMVPWMSMCHAAL